MDFELLHSRRRSCALQVSRDGRVLVRAPYGFTREQAQALVLRQQDWLEKQLRRQREWAARHPQPTEEQIRQLRRQAQALLPEKVRHYEAIMDLHPTGIKITAAKTRFGSCSAKNRLCFSLYLMAYPEPAIDYVVVHELAHIRHKNHSPAFYACVEDYRQRRQLLRD